MASVRFAGPFGPWERRRIRRRADFRRRNLRVAVSAFRFDSPPPQNENLYPSACVRFSVRGRLGSLLMLSANAGFLFAFIAGHYLNYHQIPFLGILISIVFIAAFVFFPDSPAHYLRRDDQEV